MPFPQERRGLEPMYDELSRRMERDIETGAATTGSGIDPFGRIEAPLLGVSVGIAHCLRGLQVYLGRMFSYTDMHPEQISQRNSRVNTGQFWVTMQSVYPCLWCW